MYKTWIEALFPQTRRPAARKGRKSEAAEATTPTETKAAATGVEYDESWIPEGHIQRPSAKRSKTGGSGKRA